VERDDRFWGGGEAGSAHRRIGPDYREQVSLESGLPLTMRPLVPEDAKLLAQALARFSPRTRYLWFLGPGGEFGPAELRQLSSPDGEREVSLAAFAGERGIVAMGRFVRTPAAPWLAEVSLVVDDLFHQKGIGSLMLLRLRAAALERGIGSFSGYVLAENHSMLAFLRKLGARMGLPCLGVYQPLLSLRWRNS
jgi:acetyltransferase